MESARIKVTHEYPLELHYIKARLIGKQYRKCITACRELISAHDPAETVQPLHRTFIDFYLALAHDELARSMHAYSSTKVAAITQAEQLYRDALHSLPDASSCAITPATSTNTEPSESQFEPETASETSGSSTPAIGSSEAPRDSCFIHSSHPLTHVCHDSFPLKSPPVDSPLATSSDQDDAESHDSHDQIMTLNPMLPKLQRDYSSISLLQPETRNPTSQGLMRPIRTGEATQQYHVPPRLPYSGRAYMSSRLPRLDTTSLTGSPVRKQLRTASEQASPNFSPVSPVSPLGSEGIGSDTSTISPISPAAPIQSGKDDELVNRLNATQKHLHSLDTHLGAMRAQLERHIHLLGEEKQRMLHERSERAVSRSVDAAGKVQMQRSLPNSHSFWSFTPTNVKEIEKQKRVAEGRERGWKKKRFDPTRYRILAEKAMSEL